MSGKPAKLSIAMATYNGAQLVGEQLDSFAAQHRLPDEVVISDDGSTDTTLEIIRDFAASAPFPIVLKRNRKQLGIKDNFGKAIAACTGDIIFLSDQDDVWFPDKLRVVEAYFAANPTVQVLVNEALLADAGLQSRGLTQGAEIRRVIGSNRNFFTGCCSAHQRSWHDFALPIPEAALAHDQWINCAAIELGYAMHVGEVLQYFRRHGANASASPLSDPAGYDAWKAFGQNGFADARAGWQRRADLLNQILARLDETADIAAARGWDRNRPNIEREIAALERRIALCSVPRRSRIAGVVAHWATGGYRDASGWKSAVKDLLRP